jgi:hypothetical protein
MRSITPRFLAIGFTAVMAAGILAISCRDAFAQQSQTSAPSSTNSSATNKAIGAIKTISGTAISLTPDAGPEISIVVQPTTQILRVEPGAKTLSDATAITLQDLQVGDRVRVTGVPSDDAHSLVAAKIIAIKHADLEARHQQELQDWQKRGVDGLATAVDPAAGTITITVRNKPVVVHTSSTTVIRRYPSDSVKFDDATPSTLQAIHSGDQVRARGNRNPDGTEVTADEIVSGAFRNIAGTVNSVDASSSTLTVHDLLAKKNITIKITPDSQLHQLPPEMAQRIAARFKRGAGANGSSASSGSTASYAQHQHPSGEGTGSGAASGQGAGSPGAHGAPDLQQMLSHIPAIKLSDLHKGDAVVLVSTEGTEGGGTAITLLSGVEPILEAAPGASSSSILTPWSLSAPAGDAGGP